MHHLRPWLSDGKRLLTNICNIWCFWWPKWWVVLISFLCVAELGDAIIDVANLLDLLDWDGTWQCNWKYATMTSFLFFATVAHNCWRCHAVTEKGKSPPYQHPGIKITQTHSWPKDPPECVWERAASMPSDWDGVRWPSKSFAICTHQGPQVAGTTLQILARAKA